MLSNKPYLIRAFYEWIVDNTCTPLLVMDATFPRCNVPQEHVENGQITLNVAPQAIRDLKMGNDLVEFKASFSGVVHIISAPTKAVLAIYAQENGQGMFFDTEEESSGSDTAMDWGDTSANEQVDLVTSGCDSNKSKSKIPHLKLVE